LTGICCEKATLAELSAGFAFFCAQSFDGTTDNAARGRRADRRPGLAELARRVSRSAQGLSGSHELGGMMKDEAEAIASLAAPLHSATRMLPC
jgi:hypothetical protein